MLKKVTFTVPGVDETRGPSSMGDGEAQNHVDRAVLQDLFEQARTAEDAVRMALYEIGDVIEALECFEWVHESLEMRTETGSNRLWMERFDDAWTTMWSHAQDSEDSFADIQPQTWAWENAVQAAYGVVSQAAGVQPRELKEFPFCDYDIDTGEPGTRWVEVTALPEWNAQSWSFEEGAHNQQSMLAGVQLWMHRSNVAALEPKTHLASGMAHVGKDATVQWVHGPGWEPPALGWIRGVLREAGINWKLPEGLAVTKPAEAELEPEGIEL